jgi:hypothetical protein
MYKHFATILQSLSLERETSRTKGRTLRLARPEGLSTIEPSLTITNGGLLSYRILRHSYQRNVVIDVGRPSITSNNRLMWMPGGKGLAKCDTPSQARCHQGAFVYHTEDFLRLTDFAGGKKIGLCCDHLFGITDSDGLRG